jgi:hypothetical protein
MTHDHVADEQAIRTLTASYTDAINRMDIDDIAHVYDDDAARARWQITEFQILNDGQPRFIAGRYEDEYVRRSEGWKFGRRTFTARYVGDITLTSGARPDAPTLFPLWSNTEPTRSAVSKGVDA